ncbi:hypothetical protein MF271_24295 (plasmid) [Deinococcus sp. KNUC1210]|uniref:hypothetical protein n=1 Tax=Deinococcus sp. KNUC1210 TaxID=2917691 RepID=UPI001EF00710|nr:hypothetical protein [Deinococcus sp. KNUC1210]ULH18081.1 hypothetical protein MF271_24295 [Deinococcus sp. KNUC1210]
MTQHDLPRSLPSPRPQRLLEPCSRQLSDAIRHAQPDRTDDGLSDLSYALTLEQQSTHTLPYHILAHRYLGTPLPQLELHELQLSLTALHSATTQRLVDHPTLLMLSGQRDRFLHLFPGTHTPRPAAPHMSAAPSCMACNTPS